MAHTESTDKGSVRQLVGISFPFRKDKGQFPAVDKDIDAVRNDLTSLFNTPVRTRVMRPNLGTTAHNLVFDSIGPLLEARMERSIRQTIFLNEPRVNVLKIDIANTGTEIAALVTYSVNGVTDLVELSFANPNEEGS